MKVQWPPTCVSTHFSEDFGIPDASFFPRGGVSLPTDTYLWAEDLLSDGDPTSDVALMNLKQDFLSSHYLPFD